MKLKKRKRSGSGIAAAVVMAAAAVLSWKITMGNINTNEELLRSYIEKAEYHEENGAYVTAAGYYGKALELEPDNYDLMMRAAENSGISGNSADLVKYCRMAAECDPQQTDPFIMLSEYYCEKNDYVSAKKVLSGAPDDDCIKELLRFVNSAFKEGHRRFADVKGFHGGYSAVSDDSGKWGMINSSGDLKLMYRYDDIGAYDAENDTVPVCLDGDWFFADLSGNKKYVLKEKVSWLGTYSDGRAPFMRNGKYGYTDLEYRETDVEFDYAGAFSGGVAAVEKNGRWALVNRDLKCITGYDFDSITTDRYGYCVTDGRISAVKNGKTIYLDTAGKEMPFTQRYVCGLTPEKNQEKWGYADEYGEMAVAALYEEVMPFDRSGSALVKHKGQWHVITLYVMEKDSLL